MREQMGSKDRNRKLSVSQKIESRDKEVFQFGVISMPLTTISNNLTSLRKTWSWVSIEIERRVNGGSSRIGLLHYIWAISKCTYLSHEGREIHDSTVWRDYSWSGALLEWNGIHSAASEMTNRLPQIHWVRLKNEIKNCVYVMVLYRNASCEITNSENGHPLQGCLNAFWAGTIFI